MTRSAAELRDAPERSRPSQYRPVRGRDVRDAGRCMPPGMSPWGGRPTFVVVGPCDRHVHRAPSRMAFLNDLVATYRARDGCAGDRPRPANGDAHVAQRAATQRERPQPYAPAACASSSPRRARSPRATSGRDVSHRSNASQPRSTSALGVTQALIGRSIVVTADRPSKRSTRAGSVSNRSSGKMGYAIAAAARDAGADVHTRHRSDPRSLRRSAVRHLPGRERG